VRFALHHEHQATARRRLANIGRGRKVMAAKVGAGADDLDPKPPQVAHSWVEVGQLLSEPHRALTTGRQRNIAADVAARPPQVAQSWVEAGQALTHLPDVADGEDSRAPGPMEATAR
jgi:hypothetical protein